MPVQIPAASRAMAVFEVFARERRDLSNSEMAKLLAVADSSCSDLLHTLHSLGYLMRTTRTRRFYPTVRLLETARQIAENDPLTRLAQEAVARLTDKTNESAFFGVLEPQAVRVAAVAQSRLPLRYILDVGERVALHASALGKAMLGTLPEGDARMRLEAAKRPAVTPSTVVDLDRLMAQLARGREQGWYEAHDEGTDGVTALAVAARLGDRPVAISVAGPTERIEKHRESYLAALRDVRDSLLSEH
ncbi:MULTISPECIES: IclR family transcriptional regulator [unclassified Cupriavidus]|uniref:IclR family transcriptional regulator n=1 Tax=unclassified Cupriavidus TaxID=2640874 RepID=UPI001055516D|nr:IclR family transcriptional regulator [Cupriavidus sp. L7L]MBF6989215.1 IclR family transcriptional regulator [Cupriavidus sp. IK-TO18]TDF67241.1 IclR family transcriptional regulator [Cupriavidus sp. L7L]